MRWLDGITDSMDMSLSDWTTRKTGLPLPPGPWSFLLRAVPLFIWGVTGPFNDAVYDGDFGTHRVRSKLQGKTETAHISFLNFWEGLETSEQTRG